MIAIDIQDRFKISTQRACKVLKLHRAAYHNKIFVNVFFNPTAGVSLNAYEHILPIKPAILDGGFYILNIASSPNKFKLLFKSKIFSLNFSKARPISGLF